MPPVCRCRAYQSELAAGLDLMAAVPADRPVIIAPGERASIPTGIAIALPPGCEGQIRPRSGLALRHGVTVLNSPGTVDCRLSRENYRSFSSILARFLSRWNAANALHNWCSQPRCEQ